MKQNFTVRQGALDGVEVFLSVAQHRSFRKAAAELGVTPSAISQTVRVLEARIGAALFIRTTRSVGLTEAGEQFLARAKPAFEELVAASEVARGLGQRPAGLLRLSVPRAVIPILLELVASFCRAYPEVEVELAASKEVTDLAAEGFDAAVRQGHPRCSRYGRGANDATISSHRRRQPRLLRRAQPAHSPERPAPTCMLAMAAIQRRARALVIQR
jgi:DNA-binding transcriptional LysR family regulator